jgi:hypothetical protein
MNEIFSDLPTEYARMASASEPLLVLGNVEEEPWSAESVESVPFTPPAPEAPSCPAPEVAAFANSLAQLDGGCLGGGLVTCGWASASSCPSVASTAALSEVVAFTGASLPAASPWAFSEVALVAFFGSTGSAG